MKFLANLDLMTVLMLVVIFGVVITMSTQAVSQTSASSATAQTLQVSAPGDQAVTNRKLSES